MNSSAKNPINLKWWMVLLLFCFIGIFVYYNSFKNPFHYDDLHHITSNPHIRKLSNITSLFTDTSTFSSVKERRGAGFHYRPVVMVTYALNYYAGKLNPWGYHAVNLAFHIGSAFLIFLIVKAMLGNSKQLAVTAPYFAALAAGLIFLVHPFNSEIVNYISTRSSVMSGFFYLLGFYCWVRYRSEQMPVIAVSRSPEQREGEAKQSEKGIASGILFPRNDNRKVFYIASLLAFAAGMFSKEVAITLPAMLWLYDMYGFTTVSSKQLAVNSKEVTSPRFNISTYIPYLPFILLIAVPYLVIRASWLGTTLSHSKRDVWSQIFTELPALVKHWRMFLVPNHLTPIHEAEIFRTLFYFPVIFSLIILIAYTVIAILLFFSAIRIMRVISFFMLWFLVVVLPTAIIPLNLIFQEHRGYLAIVSFAVIAGVILQEIKNTRLQNIAIVLLILLLGVYSTGTVYRNKVWRDDMTLWRDTLIKSPRSPIPYAGMGLAYKEMGEYDKAEGALKKAIFLGGGGDEILTAHQNLGQVYILQRRLDMAVYEFENTLKIYPYNSRLHNDLGIVYSNVGKDDLAEKHFNEGIRLTPADYLSFFNLGVLYAHQGKWDKSLQAYRIALKLSPDNLELRFRLGTVLEELGKPGEAAEMYKYIEDHAGADDAGLLQDTRVHLKKIGL